MIVFRRKIRVGDFLMSVWDRRKGILCSNGLVGEVNRNNSTPECEVNGRVL